MSSHWNGRQRWASAANSHAHRAPLRSVQVGSSTSSSSSLSHAARRHRAAAAQQSQPPSKAPSDAHFDYDTSHTTATGASSLLSRCSPAARSRIHERRIAALRRSGNHAAADILQRAVWKANNSHNNTCTKGANDENDDQDTQMMMTAATATTAVLADDDDASVLTFATDATNTTAQVPVVTESDDCATNIHDANISTPCANITTCANNITQGGIDAKVNVNISSCALITPEKTGPASVSVAVSSNSFHDDVKEVLASVDTPGTPDTVPTLEAASATSSPEEERTAREEEAVHLVAMAAAEEETRLQAEATAIAAAAAASAERSGRIAAAEAESMRLELSAISAGSANEVVSITSGDDKVVGDDVSAEDANVSSQKAEIEEKASTTSGSDCPLNYSISSDGAICLLPPEVSSPVPFEPPSVPEDGANTGPDQSSSSTPSSTKKKMWGRSLSRKSPTKISPASTASGTEEGDTGDSFSSRRSIDGAIANLSERMFSAVSSALPPRHPSTEAESKVVDSHPLPKTLPDYHGRKDSDASDAAPSLRSVASSATPVAGAGTRDVSSLWDTCVDAPSALDGGATAEEEDKLTFGHSGGVELSNLDRLEPEMARDLHVSGNAFHTTLKGRATEYDATSSIDIEVGSRGEVEVFSPKISGRHTKDNGGEREKHPLMDCSLSSSSSRGRASRTLAKLMPSRCRPVHALFLLIPIVSVMLYLCYTYFVEPNL